MKRVSLPSEQRYLGHPRLRKANVQIPYTSDQALEIAKCRDDIVYFAKKYVKIVHVDRGLIPFEMWEYQEKFLKNVDDNRFSISLCSRQIGKCLHKDTLLNIRNKITGKVEKVSYEELHKRVSKEDNM